MENPADNPETPPACEYHKRPGCKACTSLRIAIKADEAGKRSLADTGLRRAVEHEVAGE